MRKEGFSKGEAREPHCPTVETMETFL